MEFKDIKLIITNNLATIMVDRPKVYNAIRNETMIEINQALDEIESDQKIRVVVFTGAGEKAFVAGADISAMTTGDSYIETLQTVTKGQDVITRLEYFPKPVIARINGYALGGGTEIALGCDVRIASKNAVLGLPEVKLGIIPGYGGTQRLPRLIGLGKAKELILTGDHITADEAFKIGLLNKVVAKENLDLEIQEIAKKISANGPIALQMAKVAMNNGVQADLRTGLDLEARCHSLSYGTKDRIEGMNAFMEKRKPVFMGK